MRRSEGRPMSRKPHRGKDKSLRSLMMRESLRETMRGVRNADPNKINGSRPSNQVGSESGTGQAGTGSGRGGGGGAASGGKNGSSNRRNNVISSRRRRVLDTSLLARGMTARSIGIRVASNMKTLSPTEIERDIRHMEAYGAACVSYAQQLFAFSNRELVARGHYGPAPPARGMTITHPGQNAMPGVTMPVRIDPEEEKRLAILRKRVSASEAKREVLETEYLSLRAHYVHESHKLRRTRSAVSGELKLLRDLLKRRGAALALRRVRCAVAKDILSSLEYRAKSIGDKANNGVDPNNDTVVPTPDPSINADNVNVSANTEQEQGASPMDGVESSEETKTLKSPEKSLDMVNVWSEIESKLQEAELSCVDIKTPEELIYIKAALCADATALEAASEVTATTVNGSSNARRGARSPLRLSKDGKGGEEEESSSSSGNGGSRKKSRSERAARRGDDIEPTTSNGSKNKYELDKNSDVIPWSCRVMPRTPHGVALYLSNLSNSPELAAAFACGNIFGCTPQSLAWLEGNLPTQANPGAKDDSERLRKIREEVAKLKAELKNEVVTNSKLQTDLVEGRKHSDEICAMMTMIRSETEAVVHRHNQVLEMNEAYNAIEADNEKADAESYDRMGDDYIGDETEDGEIEDDDEGNIMPGNGEIGNFAADYDVPDEDDGNGQPVREVIVPTQSASAESGKNVGNRKRGYVEIDPEDPETKRRNV